MNTNIMVIRMTTFIVELFEVSLVEDSFPVDYKLLQPAREVLPVHDRVFGDDDGDEEMADAMIHVVGVLPILIMIVIAMIRRNDKRQWVLQ